MNRHFCGRKPKGFQATKSTWRRRKTIPDFFHAVGPAAAASGRLEVGPWGWCTHTPRCRSLGWSLQLLGKTTQRRKVAKEARLPHTPRCAGFARGASLMEGGGSEWMEPERPSDTEWLSYLWQI